MENKMKKFNFTNVKYREVNKDEATYSHIKEISDICGCRENNI